MTTKEDIKDWLKKTGKTRQALAEQVGVAKGTVNNWLSGADRIPYAKLQLIERIIAETEQPVAPAQAPAAEMTAIGIMMTLEQRAQIAAAARRLGLTLEQFIVKAALDRAQRTTGNLDQTTSSAC